MSTKVKGLLKGLRYISQIFENEKEPDMQIGFPTDVKHVAHIGWDGPSATAPTWMTEYKSNPDTSAAVLTSGEFAKAEDGNRTEDAKPPISKESKEKQRRRRSSSGGAALSLDNPSEAAKNCRRHHSSGGSIIADDPDPSGSTTSSRRRQTQTGAEDGPKIPKQTRRKKTKGGSSGGGVGGGGGGGGEGGGGGGGEGGGGSNRLKFADADNSSEPGSVSGSQHGVGDSSQSCPVSILEPFEEEKECDEISKKLRDL